MPTRRYLPVAAALCRRWPRGAFVACIASHSVGCRALRCPKVSDEEIAVARQLSLQGMAARDRGRWDQAETLYAEAVLNARATSGPAAAMPSRSGSGATRSRRSLTWKRPSASRATTPSGWCNSATCIWPAAIWRVPGTRPTGRLPPIAIWPAHWALRGQVLQGQGSRTESLASFHRALTLQQHYPEVQLALAEIYSEQGRPQRALATLQSLADSLPADQVPVEVLVGRGWCCGSWAATDDAARSLAQAANRGNPPVDLLYELARTQLAAGDTAAARLAVVAALAREPNHAGCLALREELATSQGTMAAAMR